MIFFKGGDIKVTIIGMCIVQAYNASSLETIPVAFVQKKFISGDLLV